MKKLEFTLNDKNIFNKYWNTSIESLNSNTTNSIQSTKSFIKLYRTELCTGCVGLLSVVLLLVSILSLCTVYEYSYKGERLGIVKAPQNVLGNIESAQQTLSSEVGAEIPLGENDEIKIEAVIIDEENIDDDEQVLKKLTDIEPSEVFAYAIKNGDEVIAYLDNKQDAKSVLKKVKNAYLNGKSLSDYKSVEFAEPVTIEKIKVPPTKIEESDDVYKKIMTGGVEKKNHVVREDDTDYDIALEYGVSVDDLAKWNPDKNIEVIHEGDILKLEEDIPLLDVKTVETKTYDESYGPDIRYEDTENLYKGMEIEIKSGKSGKRTVTSDIIRKNGVETDRELLSYRIKKIEKKTEILRGTEENPEEIGKGHFTMPMNGRLTSEFGKRWGRLHAGIDIAAPVGTDVYAADAGEVTFSGMTNNGYGYLVIIDHGNDRVTMYAHNSKLLVDTGDTVYKGQHIAESGNTGYSTGPHLHFEVKLKGKAKDPMKYL